MGKEFNRLTVALSRNLVYVVRQESQEVMEKKIRYGIIGFGSFAERAIAPAIRASGNSELVALQKRSLEAAKHKAQEYSVPLAFESVEDLVRQREIDAVFIASANLEHCRGTVAAAKAGKHVLVEKPMAMNAIESKTMIDACRRNRVKLMVGHMIRFSPLVVRVRDIVRSGPIGTVRFARADFMYDGRLSRREWFKDRKVAGGGPIFDIGVHCLDTLRFVLDAEVLSVAGTTEPIPGKVRTETTAALSLRLTKGTLASIHCSFESSVRRSLIEIIGTDGMLSATHFTVGDRGTPLTIFEGAGDHARTETITVPNLYGEEIRHFSSCILENELPCVSGEEGLKNQKVLDAAMKLGKKSGKSM